MSTAKWGGQDSVKARAVCRPIAEQGGPCFRCKKPIREGQEWHADHVVPRGEGGTDEPGNLWPSHDKCNEREGGQRGARITNAARRQRRNSAARDGSLSAALQPTSSSTLISLTVPDDLPAITAKATILSPTPDDVDLAEAELGAKWLGLPLTPQGYEVVRVMQAVRPVSAQVLDPTTHAAIAFVPLYRFVTTEMARRSAKTTSAFEVALGRALTRPGYKIASTAQTGLKSRSKLIEIQTALIAAGFEKDEVGKCLRGAGDTRINFSNQSTWQALPPDGAAFRSDAFDLVLVDEGGEIGAEAAKDLLAGLIPTMDTRPGAQLWVGGTPGEARAGMLWTALEWLRNGRARTGGVVYEAGDREVFIDPETGEVNWELLLRLHPGISCGLTDVETIVGNIDVLGLPKWEREYLCRWPLTAGVVALDVQAWADCEAPEAEEDPEVPENAGVGWSVDKDGTSSAIVAAWRDPEGRAVFDVLAFGEGYDWLPAEAVEVQKEHRQPLGYDALGPCLEVADLMSRPPNRVRTTVVPFKDQVGSHARLDKEIARRNVRHFGDPNLTRAVEESAWRPAGGARMFLNRPGSSVLVAAAQALWLFDSRNRVRTSGSRPRAITGRDSLADLRAARERRTA